MAGKKVLITTPGSVTQHNKHKHCVPPQRREIDAGDPNADVFKILQLTELLGI